MQSLIHASKQIDVVVSLIRLSYYCEYDYSTMPRSSTCKITIQSGSHFASMRYKNITSNLISQYTRNGFMCSSNYWMGLDLKEYRFMLHNLNIGDVLHLARIAKLDFVTIFDRSFQWYCTIMLYITVSTIHVYISLR